MEAIKIKKLTRAAFARFGDVIDSAGSHHYPINAGMCERYHDLAQLEVKGENARQIVSIFEAQPHFLPLTLAMAERHPLGSQAFIPLSDRPFLVIAAPDQNGAPGLPIAFMTSPWQGVNYRPNVWHGVVTPIGAAQRFVVIDRAGDGNNLEEFFFAEPFLVTA